MAERPPSLILASASPRRQALLKKLGVDFSVWAADIDETPLAGEDAAGYVSRLASAKARAVAARRPGAAVLAADTTVVVDGVLFGKPTGRADAERMLRVLSGRSHEVFTAVTLLAGGNEKGRLSVNRVTFRPLDAEEISAYCRTDEPMDKAGAYGLQGRGGLFVTGVSGDRSGVVGLPLRETGELLRDLQG